MTETKFPKLFEPARIGKIRLSNRVVMLPMGTAYASVMGEVTQKTVDHYVERAKGGVGLITVGGTSPFGMRSPNRMGIYDDRFLAGHYDLVEAIHTEGVPACLQLNHPGRQWQPWALESGQPVSSSDVTCFRLGEHPFPKPRPLERQEIYQIMDKWAEGAARAKKVGYDMVELHAAHGYLIQQFMSPYTNKRTDEFGGSLENRMRFALELLSRVKALLGYSFPVGFRLSAEEFIDGGITIRDSSAMAKMLEEAGAAYISVSCGAYDTSHTFNDTMRDPEGWKLYHWEAIKQAVRIPVIAGGGLRTPSFCESVLAQGKADFIGLARPLLADPQWPEKAREGRPEDIRPCISCLECVAGSTRRRQGGSARRCSVNAATGRESQFIEIKPAAVKKKVMVVGGGPGGMEAARIAALRGHEVTLYDRGEELGGTLRLAAAPPGKEKINTFVKYLTAQLEKAEVAVKLGIEVTPELVRKENPDAVIVATGARPLNPPSLAIDASVLTAWDVLSGRAKVTNKKIVVVGGGMVGVETAEYLVHQGNQVTIVEMLPKLAADMEMHNRFVILQSLKEAGVIMLTRREVVEVAPGGIWAVDKDSGEKVFVPGQVVLAVGATPNTELVDALEGTVAELYPVGDCNEPRIIMEAIYEGSRAARRI